MRKYAATVALAALIALAGSDTARAAPAPSLDTSTGLTVVGTERGAVPAIPGTIETSNENVIDMTSVTRSVTAEQNRQKNDIKFVGIDPAESTGDVVAVIVTVTDDPCYSFANVRAYSERRSGHSFQSSAYVTGSVEYAMIAPGDSGTERRPRSRPIRA